MSQASEEPSLATTPENGSAMRAVGYFRWGICFLLFAATTINYVDRQIISILKKPLTAHFRWDERDYANIVTAFQFAYAFGYLFAGRMMDYLGVRFGLPLIVGLWSLAAAAHGLVTLVPPDSTYAWTFRLFGWTFTFGAAVICFSLLRLALGIFEGGNFPAAVKTVGDWFPIKERALATGLLNCGSTIGAVVCPLMVPWINARWGWEATFYVTGALGFGWLILWLIAYRAPEQHPWLSAGERSYIQSGRAPVKPAVRISWVSLLAYRQTWAFVIGMLLTSPVWWFYLFWTPDFFQKKFKIDDISMPVMVMYLMTLVGSVGGGWLPAWLIRRGMTLNMARKLAMLACAICVLPAFFAPLAPNLWVAVIFVGIAASAHQGWAANLYTLVSDTMPKETVSSVVGIGGMAAGLASVVTAQIVGYVLQATGNYFVLFAGASTIYLVALLAIHLLVPRIEQAKVARGFEVLRQSGEPA